MKKELLKILIIYFFIQISCFLPQTINFSKTYTAFGDSTFPVSISQTEDGSYLLSGYNIDKLFISKLDTLGVIIWKREYDTYHREMLSGNPVTFLYPNYKYSNLLLTNDNNILAVSTKRIDEKDSTDLYLLKIDQNGDTIGTKSYDHENFREIGFDIFNTADGGFIIGTGQQGFRLKSIIFKINYDGELQWSKKMLSGTRSNVLVKLTPNKFIITDVDKIQVIDELGNALWTKHSNFSITEVTGTYDKNILLLGSNNISKLDSSGNTLWTKTFSHSSLRGLQKILATKNNEILIANSESILVKLNTEGEILWEKEIFNTPSILIETKDSGFVLGGKSNSNIWLLKTDNYGYFNYFSFLSPAQNSSFNIHGCTTISWYTSLATNIELNYSINDGDSWDNIITNYPVNAGKSYFDWDTPKILSSNCKLSIKDNLNPDLSDTIDFSLVYNSNLVEGYNYISVNEVKMWISNEGDGSHDPNADGSGFFWPGGLCASIPAIFEDGFIYGGIVDSQVNVNGSNYRHGWQPGNILENGIAANSADPQFKVWKIYRDMDLLPRTPIREAYEFDYNNWPVEYGAPWIDTDDDGVFTRGLDQPEFIGDEVLFHVSNDLDEIRTNFVYGSPPIGLEFQVTVWAHNTDDFLKDVVFKKYLMINKSGKTIQDMYFSYWTDDDLGFASDDFVGCDTLLNLGYSYNGDNFDDDYYESNPPAIGHMMVQGPKASANASDSAKFNNKWVKGAKNISLTSFLLYIGSDPLYSDPVLGEATGAIETYNNMQGFIWNGDPFIDPNTRNPTKFCLSGDPVEGSGWYEGAGWPGGKVPSDRRFLMSSGPFDVAPGDTQEVVYAIFMARGSDNIQSVAELKNTARAIQDYWDNIIYTDVEDENSSNLPTYFALSQNYPNPFNPTTTIRYSIPSSVIASSDFEAKQSNEISSVTSFPRNDEKKVILVVYDILGRQVKTLINENQKPGNYSVEFDASKLTSGVYFYRLKTGDFIKTRKMLLLK